MSVYRTSVIKGDNTHRINYSACVLLVFGHTGANLFLKINWKVRDLKREAIWESMWLLKVQTVK